MKKKKAMLVARIDEWAIIDAKASAAAEDIGFSEWVARAIEDALSRKRVDAALAKLTRERDAK